MSPTFSQPFQSPAKSPTGHRHVSGDTLPRTGLLFYAKAPGLTDTIGLSSITLSSGSGADLMNATWPFPDTAATRTLDSMAGRDVLFDTAGNPYDKSGNEWASLPNNYCLIVGPKGIAGYGSAQTRAIYTKAFRALGNRLNAVTVDQGLSATADGGQIRVH